MEVLISFWDTILEPNLVTKTELRDELNSVENRLNQKIMKEGQDTRDYTDKKFNELKGEMNTKFDTLTGILEHKNVLTPKEAFTVKHASSAI